MNSLFLNQPALIAKQPQVHFPLQTAEQSANTLKFLQLVADTYGTGCFCGIFEQHLVKQAKYLRYFDEFNEKRYVLDCQGNRIPAKIVGVDWTSPTLYDCISSSDDLAASHDAVALNGERPGLTQTLMEATTGQKFLFVPALLRKRNLITPCKAVPTFHCARSQCGGYHAIPLSSVSMLRIMSRFVETMSLLLGVFGWM